MLDLNNIIVKCTGQYDKQVVRLIYGLANIPVGETTYPAGHPHAGTYFGGTGGPFGIVGIDELVWESGAAPRTATLLYVSHHPADAMQFWSEGDPPPRGKWSLFSKRYQPKAGGVKIRPAGYMPNAGEKCLARWPLGLTPGKTDYIEVVFAGSFKGTAWLLEENLNLHVPLEKIEFKPFPEAKTDLVRRIQSMVSDHLTNFNGMKSSQAELLASELFENKFRQIEPLDFETYEKETQNPNFRGSVYEWLLSNNHIVGE